MATDITIVLGALAFGTRIDEPQSFDLLDQFTDLGGTWIDTANNYSFWMHPTGHGGQSETIIGNWLAKRSGLRERVRLSTKGGAEPTVPDSFPEHAEGLSGPVLRSAIRGSLERLQTGRVDLYWAHIEDRSVALEETVETLGAFVAEGLADRLGASNHPAWRVERARALAAARGLAGYTAMQLRWSYLRPLPGVALPQSGHVHASPETLDYVASTPGMWLWAYNTLLDGGYTRPDRPLPEAYAHAGTGRRLAALDEIAGELGATRNQVVLAWLAGGETAVSPIVGVTTAAQVSEAMGARELQLTAAQRDRLDTAS